MRVGGEESIQVDVRVIAATNRDVRTAVKSGVLREDLYHRLAVMAIRMPPLRERREDIPLLVKHFLSLIQEASGTGPKDFSANAVNCLMRWDWPGNVRELHNAIRSAAILSEGDIIHTCDLPFDVQNRAISASPDLESNRSALSDAVEQMERKMITEILAQTAGNKSLVQPGGNTSPYRFRGRPV